MSIQSDVWNYLRTAGLTENATSAVMGNIQWESGFVLGSLESNGVGYGLCQWSYSRRTQLEAYGVDQTHQLNFLWSELTGTNRANTGADLQYFNTGYLTLAQFLAGTATIESLTESFCFSWERPAVATAHLADRQASANGFFTQFTGGSVNPPTPTPPITTESRMLQNLLNAIGAKDDRGQTLIVNGMLDTPTIQAKTRARSILNSILN